MGLAPPYQGYIGKGDVGVNLRFFGTERDYPGPFIGSGMVLDVCAPDHQASYNIDLTHFLVSGTTDWGRGFGGDKDSRFVVSRCISVALATSFSITVDQSFFIPSESA